MKKLRSSKLKIAFYVVIGFFPALLFGLLTYTAYTYTIKPLDLGEIPFVSRDLTPLRVKPHEPGGIHFSNQDKVIYEHITESSPPASAPPIEKKPAIAAKKTPTKAAPESVFDVINTAKKKTTTKVRLAILPSKVAAEKEWRNLLRKHPNLLKNQQYSITMHSSFTNKNTYQILILSLSDEGAASLCAKLKQFKQQCIILH